MLCGWCCSLLSAQERLVLMTSEPSGMRFRLDSSLDGGRPRRGGFQHSSFPANNQCATGTGPAVAGIEIVQPRRGQVALDHPPLWSAVTCYRFRFPSPDIQKERKRRQITLLQRIFAFTFAFLLACTSLHAFGPYKTTDEKWPETKDLQIEWKEDWDQTARHNEQRWREEMKTSRMRGQEGERWFRMRMITLFERMLVKFPDVDQAKRISGLWRICDDLHQQGFIASANLYLKKIVDDAEPGDVNMVLTGLRRILELTPAENAFHVEDGEEWVEYASSRILALYRNGLVPVYEDTVLRAMQARMTILRTKGRLKEAMALLEDIEEFNGRDGWVQNEENRFRQMTMPGEEKDEVQSPELYLAAEVKQALSDAEAGGAHNAAKLLPFLSDEKIAFQIIAHGEKHSSMWSRIGTTMNAQDAETKKQFAATQEEEARFELETIEPPVQSQKLFAIYRRFPLCLAGNEALLRYGEMKLTKGHYGDAFRSFLEVIHHPLLDVLVPQTSEKKTLEAKARSGLWMCLANLPGGEAELQRELDRSAKDARYPWLGEELSSEEIRKRLAARPASNQQPAASNQLPTLIITLEKPPTNAWSHPLYEILGQDMLDRFPPAEGEIHSFASGTLVCGPSLLAWYEGDSPKPAWVKTGNKMIAHPGRRPEHYLGNLIVPNSFEPSLYRGRIYTRWGIQKDTGVPTSLAAFDQQSGDLIWSTSRIEEWQQRKWQPINDPVALDGRVYGLAIETEKESAPVLLICHDADDGRLLWARPLGEQKLYQEAQLEFGRWGNRGLRCDLVQFGDPVKVNGGSVYCQTNMGILAKLDARDGLVEWITHYERPKRLDRATGYFIGRRRTAPIVSGETVLFAPRDSRVLLALDAQSGKVVWEQHELDSDRVIPVGEGRFILQGELELSLISAQGQAIWSRSFDEQVEVIESANRRVGVPPVTEGAGGPRKEDGRDAHPAIPLTTASALLHVDVDSGRTVSSMPWPEGISPRTATLTHKTSKEGKLAPAILALRDSHSQPNTPQQVRPVPLQPPLQIGWHHEAQHPLMWSPPAGSGLQDRLFVYSEGRLECLQRAARGTLYWSKSVPLDFQLRWLPGAMLLVYERRVIAVDGKSGQTRWDVRLPFNAEVHGAGGNSFVFVDMSVRSSRIGALDLRNGKLRWQRGAEQFRLMHDRLDPSTSNNTGHHPETRVIRCDGDRVYIFGQLHHLTAWMMTLRDADGEFISTLPFPAKQNSWAYHLSFHQGLCAVASQQSWPVNRFQLDGQPVDDAFNDDKYEKWQVKEFKSDGPWLQVKKELRNPNKVEFVVYNILDPNYKLTRPSMGLIEGDVLYEATGQKLSVIDLKSKNPLGEYELGPNNRPDTILIRALQAGSHLLVASSSSRNEPLQFDVIDSASGKLLGTHQWKDPFQQLFQYTNTHRFEGDWREQQIALADDAIFVADENGINAWVSETVVDEPPAQTTPIVYQRNMEFEVDGHLDEWKPIEPATLKDGRGGEATFRMTHEGDWMHLSLRTPDSTPKQHIGSGRSGGGDWLEFAYGQFNDNDFHWGFGLDARGRQIVDSFRSKPLPEGSLVGLRYDFIDQVYNYELRLPAFPRNRGWNDWRKLGISFIVWDDSGDGYSRRRFTFGSGLVGNEVEPQKHARAYMHSLTKEGEEAAFEIAYEFPESSFWWDFVEGMFDVRHDSLGLPLEQQFLEFIARHPNGIWTERALEHIARQRPELDAKARAEILKLAADRGVPEYIRSNFDQQMQSRMEQSVYFEDEKNQLRDLTISFNDRIHEHEWKWANWGQTRHGGGDILGPLPAKGAWHTLTVSMLRLGMHQSPIYGIGFQHHGRGPVYWDQTNFIRPEMKHTFIDETIPDARREGDWTEVGTPVMSGKKAFTNQVDGRPNKLHRLMHPIIEHIVPPVNVPYISQWVFIDPDKPPKAVSIALHNGTEWNFRALWGDMYQHPRPAARHVADHYLGPRIHWGHGWNSSNDTGAQQGRYMGPLPKAGEWHELRIPITWTPYPGRAIEGIRFENLRGQCYWDRTAIVANGKEVVIVEDDTPAGRVSRDWVWVEAPVKSGKRAHFGNQSNTFETYGEYGANVVSELDHKIYQHISHDPLKLAHALIKHLPALQESDLAKAFFDQSIQFIEGSLLDKPGVRVELSRKLIEAKAWPNLERCARLLGFQTTAYRDAGIEDAHEKVEKLIAELDLPLEARHLYRRKYAGLPQHFVRDWQIIGMYPNQKCEAYDKAYEPETDGYKPNVEYTLGTAQLKWQLYESPTDLVDLMKAFKTDNDFMMAYSVCWLFFPKAMRIRLELGADDGFKTWLNGKPFVRWHRHWSANPRDVTWDYNVPSGWSEFMIKLGNAGLDWGFYIQFVDAEGFGPPEGFEVRSTPPPGWQGREQRVVKE